MIKISLDYFQKLKIPSKVTNGCKNYQNDESNNRTRMTIIKRREVYESMKKYGNIILKKETRKQKIIDEQTDKFIEQM